MRLLFCGGRELLLWYLRKVRNYSWEPGALFSPCGCSQTLSITSSFQFAQKLFVHVLGQGQAGSGYCDTLWAVICTRAVTPPISSCWTLRSQLHVSSTAEVTAQGLTWVCRDRTDLTVRESWQRSLSCSASLSDSQKEIGMTSSFPTCP